MRMKYLTQLNTERKQQISSNSPNYHVRQNQEIFAGVNSRRSEEVQNENQKYLYPRHAFPHGNPARRR